MTLTFNVTHDVSDLLLDALLDGCLADAEVAHARHDHAPQSLPLLAVLEDEACSKATLNRGKSVSVVVVS